MDASVEHARRVYQAIERLPAAEQGLVLHLAAGGQEPGSTTPADRARYGRALLQLGRALLDTGPSETP